MTEKYFGNDKRSPLKLLALTVNQGYLKSFHALYAHVEFQEESSDNFKNKVEESTSEPSDSSNWVMSSWTPYFLLRCAYNQEQKTLIDFFWQDVQDPYFVCWAAEFSDYKHVKLTLDQLSDDDLDDGAIFNKTLLSAFISNSKDIVNYLFDKHSFKPLEVVNLAARSGNAGEYHKALSQVNLEDLDLQELLGHAIVGSNGSIVNHVLGKGAVLSDVKHIRALMRTAVPELIYLALEQIENTDDHLFLAFSNAYGPYSGGLSAWEPKLEGGGQVFLIGLSEDVIADSNIMGLVSGVVNPGADDTFPWTEEYFSWEDVLQSPARKFDDFLTVRKMAMERFYHDVLDYSDTHSIPFLGLCGGAQHLVLHQGGFLQRVYNHLDRLMKVHLVKGTIAHYHAMTEKERECFRITGFLPEIIIDEVYVCHHFAGVEHLLGCGMELGGVSEENVPEIFSKGLWKLGCQFHPEGLYLNDKNEVNRNKQILDSYLNLCIKYKKLRREAESEQQLSERMDAIEAELKALLKNSVSFVFHENEKSLVA